jgi:hypothetical protein
LTPSFEERTRNVFGGVFAVCSIIWALEAVLLTREIQTQMAMMLGATLLLGAALWFSVVDA